MWNGLKRLYARTGRMEKLFVLLLALHFVPMGLGLAVLVQILLYLTGFVVALRLARRGMVRLIWRLRNRLLVAYLFIAVVPILLLLTLVGLAVYGVTGQVAVYLVSTEIGRRTTALANAANGLARTPAPNQPELARRLAGFIGERFPTVEILAPEFHYPPDAALTQPPAGWGETSGVIIKDGQPYAWAHAGAGAEEVTILAPLTREFLSGVEPGLGDVLLVNLGDTPANQANVNYGGKTAPLAQMRAHAGRVPPKYISADVQITGVYPMPVARWESPKAQENVLLVVHTRTSAVLAIIFGQKLDWGQLAFGIFLAVAVLFLIVEIISLVIGVSLTRTITGAVHELYEGTERIKAGDFAHRIPVYGKDQLAELATSFNAMTEHLGKLIVVAKEKERMQSELEIAREVQLQLFPKDVPRLRSLQITGVCHPARMVSGDYYDFMSLPEESLAFAIGDVAGKGISAALLMAAIQSTMRTQLSAGAPVAVAAGNGGGRNRLSTAALVSTLNKQLYANTSPEKYATFYFALYDEASYTLTYTNAGHLPPVLLRGGNPELLEVTGTVVGAFPFSQYDEKQVRLGTGDLVVAYTDGIVEPENEYGEMFGEDRLKDLLVKHAKDSTEEIIARSMEAVRVWTGSDELQDDMTMLVARRL